MPRILFAALHRPDRSPSQRFRFEQYLSYLEENGFECTYSYLIDQAADRFFYKPGNNFKKLVLFLKSGFKRWQEGCNISKYDIVFVQRESFMTGSYFFEKMVAKSSTKLVFDFDDSIWIQNVSKANKHLSFLKNPDKTKAIIELADLITPGNDFLADYARQFNNNICIIPTTIDTEEYKPSSKTKHDHSVCIGWSGSFSTIEHFKYSLPVLEKIKEKYGDKVYFKVIGDGNYMHPDLNIQGIAWQKEGEVEELNEFDIGIMPLMQTEWEKGKCGLKGLQYMALEIPTIVAPVGVNIDIIKDGENGMLANTQGEWINKLSQLIESEELRKNIGKASRQTVIDHYSVENQKDVYLEMFEGLLK
jgi:glycosyltransferase involved in cell wall biosynthesis